MAYWYVRSFPEEHVRFTSLKENTPTYNDMLQCIESKHQRGDTRPRGWIKVLHKFSHVDRLSVRMAIVPREGQISFALGPQQDERLFRFCTSEALAVIGALV